MKRFVWGIAVLVLFLVTGYSSAADEEKKGASETAYEHASERSVFNRFGDWFATVGKSEEEKAKILEERKARTTANRAKRSGKRTQEIEGTHVDSSENEVKDETEEMKKSAYTDKETEKTQEDAVKARKRAQEEKGKTAQNAEESDEEMEEAEEATSSDEDESTGRKKGLGRGKAHQKK